MAKKDKTLEQLNITVVALVAVVAVVGITAIVLNGPVDATLEQEDELAMEPQNTAGNVYYYANGEPKLLNALEQRAYG